MDLVLFSQSPTPFQSVTNLHAHAARIGVRTHPHQLTSSTSRLLMHVELTAANHERSNPVQSWLAGVFKQARQGNGLHWDDC